MLLTETRVNEAQLTNTTLVHKHEQQKIKVKYKSKGREMQTQDYIAMCYRRENRRTQRKNLFAALQAINQSTRQ